MVLVWQIADNSSNLPNFPPAKHSHYTVHSADICMYMEVTIDTFNLHSLILFDQLMYSREITIDTFNLHSPTLFDQLITLQDLFQI